MTDLLKSILLGIGCLSILGFVGCSVLGTGLIVAADNMADNARAASNDRDNQKSPWDK